MKPPCWFLFCMAQYWKIQQLVQLFLIYFIPQYQITTEWHKHQQRHSVELMNPSIWCKSKINIFHDVNQKFKHLLLFFSTLCHTKKERNQGSWQIRVWTRAHTCIHHCIVQTLCFITVLLCITTIIATEIPVIKPRKKKTLFYGPDRPNFSFWQNFFFIFSKIL